MHQAPAGTPHSSAPTTSGAGIADEVMAGQHLDTHAFRDQAFCNRTAQHVHDHGAGDGGGGAGAPLQAFDLDNAVPLWASGCLGQCRHNRSAFCPRSGRVWHFHSGYGKAWRSRAGRFWRPWPSQQ